MKLQEQIEQLYHQLNLDLDHFSQGRKFYSFREICSKFNVNQRVVSGALDRLEEEKLIRRESCVGIFSCVTRKPSAKQLLFAAPDFPSEVLQIWGKIVSEMATCTQKYKVRKYFYDPMRPIAPQLDCKGVDALLFLPPAYRFEFASEALVALPIVYLGGGPQNSRYSRVGSDDLQGGMLAAQYLMKRGHRKLLIAKSEFCGADVQERIRGFELFATLSGATVTSLVCGTQNAESASQSLHDSLNEYLEARGWDFSGMFVISDASVPGALAALREHGIQVPDEVSIIGFDGVEGGAFYHPALTSVGSDFVRMGELLFEYLDRFFTRQDGSFSLQIPMHILERDSVSVPHKKFLVKTK